MKKSTMLAITGLLAAVTALVAVMVFNSSFAKNTIDYFSFFAAGFLIIDALWKITRRDDAFFPQQLVRLTRLIIGVCILTIHIMQYVYGV